MIGTFAVTKYADRRHFEHDCPHDVVVSRNAFTNEGLRWMWSMLLGQERDAAGGLTDQLQSARIVVGNGTDPFSGTDRRLAGDQTAQADMVTGYPALLGMTNVGDEGLEVCRLTFRSTFGERDAIFDWQERGVVTAQGVLLDRAVSDNGRKVLGSVWTVEASLDLTR